MDLVSLSRGTYVVPTILWTEFGDLPGGVVLLEGNMRGGIGGGAALWPVANVGWDWWLVRGNSS